MELVSMSTFNFAALMSTVSAIALALAGKANALLANRAYVIPQDIKDVACDVMRHRITLSYEAEAENITPDNVINYLLEELRTP